MYTVIGYPRSRTLRILWALEELGLEYELDPRMPHDPEVLALNGTGKIPVLSFEGTTITDSVAILTYLADRYGQLTYPAGTLDRARQDALTQTVVSEVDAAVWMASKHKFVLPKEQRVARMLDVAKWEFERAMGQLADGFGPGPFLTGAALTVPDIVLGHCAGWGLSLKFDLPGGAFGAYLKALRKRPAMQRAMDLVDARSA